MTDMPIECRRCGRPFVWSHSDQVEAVKAVRVDVAITAREKEIVEVPKECPECRRKETSDGRR